MTIFLLYFHKIRNVVVMMTQDAESYSVTSHTLLRAESHQQKVPLSESEPRYGDNERNTTLHITRVTTEHT